MKVIVDNKIPYIKEAIEALADEVVYLPGKEITPEVVKDADALITRTRTRCDRTLLAGSKVKFIGTATIGFDHIERLIVTKQVLHGATVRDVTPVLLNSICIHHYYC
mgnify:CR=1 FL=1